MKKSVEVKHRGGTYTVTLVDMAELARSLPSDAFLITDENVWSAWKNTSYVISFPSATSRYATKATMASCNEAISAISSSNWAKPSQHYVKRFCWRY